LTKQSCLSCPKSKKKTKIQNQIYISTLNNLLPLTCLLLQRTKGCIHHTIFCFSSKTLPCKGFFLDIFPVIKTWYSVVFLILNLLLYYLIYACVFCVFFSSSFGGVLICMIDEKSLKGFQVEGMATQSQDWRAALTPEVRQKVVNKMYVFFFSFSFSS